MDNPKSDKEIGEDLHWKIKKMNEFTSLLQQKYNNKSLFLFNNRFFPRKVAIFILESKCGSKRWFERISLLIIIINCILLSLYDPLHKESLRNQILDYSEYALTGIFLSEMVFKIFAMGLVLHKGAYLRSIWNIMDCIIVFAGVLEILLLVILGPGQGNLSFFSALRALRLLRPLRAITSIKELRIIVTSLVKSIPMLLNSFVLYMLFLIFMTLLGIQIFQGVLRRRCHHVITNEIYDSEQVCGYDYDCPSGFNCYEKGSNPSHGFANFDNVIWGFIMTYTAVTTEGWTSYMYTYMDVHPMSFLFFLFLLFFGSLFILQLALVVITVAFGKNVQDIRLIEETDMGNKTKENNLLAKFKKILLWIDKYYEKIKCCHCYNWVQTKLKKFVSSKLFLSFFTLLTILNSFVLALDHYGIDPTLKLVLDIFNYIFVALFTIESLLKIIGLGPKDFLKDILNLFDILIIFFSFVEILFQNIPNSGLTAFRTIRLLRAVKVLKAFPTIRKLIIIVFKSIVSAGMITLLLFLVIFIFALLGMQLFGGTFGTFETPRPNFDTLVWAVISAFTIATGEDWNVIMDMYLEVSPWYFAFYFMILYGIGFYIILNLFVAVMVQNFAEDDVEVKKNDNQMNFRELKKKLKSLTRHFFSKKIAPKKPDVTALKVDIKSDETTSKFKKFLVSRIYGDYSLFLLPNNKLRKFLYWLVTNRFFESLIIVLILTSTMTLILDGPYLLPGTPLSQAIIIINYILTTIFGMEALIKIIAMGLLFQKNAYLRSGWNALDFLIVIVGIISIFSNGIEVFRSIRLLRTLRPLRFINKIPGLKIVLDCLIKSIPHILNVFGLACIVYVIFGIMGVNFFAGKFSECSIQKFETKDECIQGGGIWETEALNFDNILNALLTLFSISTMETWPEVLTRAIDARGVDMSPERDHNLWATLYFMTFILIGSFFIVNLFLGVLIDNYYRLKEKSGSILLTEKQKEWVDMQKIILNRDNIEKKPSRPENKFRAIIYDCMTFRNIFEYLVVMMVLLNIVLISFSHYGQDQTWEWIVISTSQCFSLFFIGEFILKIVAFGFKSYFSNFWNIADFVIIVLSSIGGVLAILLEALVPGRLGTIFTILQVLRMIRLFRVVKGIRILLKTLFISIPSLINIFSLLLLVFSIFAILGNSLFGRVKRGEEINEWNNFETFWMGLLTLIRASTGEDWPDIMAEYMVEEPYCSRKIGNCGSRWMAALYFSSFALIGYFVMMNLFVAVILENFSSLISMNELNDQVITKFQKSWRKYDPSSEYLSYNLLPLFLYDLGPPLGIPKDIRYNALERLIKDLDLKDYDGKVNFYETLIRLTQYRFGVHLPDDLQSKFQRKYRNLLPVTHSTTPYTLSQVVYALKIQKKWRDYVMKKKEERRNSIISIQHVNEIEVPSSRESIKTFDENTYDPSDNSILNEYDEMSTENDSNLHTHISIDNQKEYNNDDNDDNDNNDNNDNVDSDDKDDDDDDGDDNDNDDNNNDNNNGNDNNGDDNNGDDNNGDEYFQRKKRGNKIIYQKGDNLHHDKDELTHERNQFDVSLTRYPIIIGPKEQEEEEIHSSQPTSSQTKKKKPIKLPPLPLSRFSPTPIEQTTTIPTTTTIIIPSKSQS